MLETHRGEVKRYFWRNYLLHGIEGGIYMGGVALVDMVTILPRLVEVLGGGAWLIAYTPTLLSVGTALPGLFLAHRLERRLWFKPIVLVAGVFQRLPFLLAGLGLLLWGSDHPGLALGIVALAPLISGLACGATLPAWQELVAKTVPEERRASLWALRAIITTAMGFGAAGVLKLVMDRWPGTEGYGTLFLLVFAATMVSFVLFSFLKETHLPVRRPGAEHSLASYLKSVPGLVRKDRELAYYLASRFIGGGFFIMVSFLSPYALKMLGKSDSFLAVLLAAQMAGGMAGNLAGGWLGDKRGGRLPTLMGHASLGALCLAAPWAQSEAAVVALYVLFGFGANINNVGLSTFSLEMAPVEWRVSYQALINFVAMLGMLVFAPAGALISGLTGSFAAKALPAAACITVAGSLIWKMKEPRKAA
jgi:predicted MFS family arabinose efflux permease